MEKIGPWTSSSFNWPGIVTLIKQKRKQIAVGMTIGFTVLLLDRGAFLAVGFPYGGDTLSNLIPAAYFRAAIRSGTDPFVTPWYEGMMLWENEFFKGFYPLWWPLFTPGVPQALYLKFLLIVHYLAAGVVAYVSVRRELELAYALPIAFLFVLPMAYFNAHISKTMAWPWVVLGTWQLTPKRLDAAPRRAGAILGLSGGIMLLIANAYFAFYLAILAGAILIATRAWDTVRAAAIVAVIVGSPKLISVAFAGGRDTIVSTVGSFKPLVAGLIGIPIGWIQLEAYAVVGVPVCVIAVTTVLYAYWNPDRFPTNWLIGCVSAVIVGLLLATKATLIYSIPLMDTFRVAQRAILVLALAALLTTVLFIHVMREVVADTETVSDHTMKAVIVALLVVSVGNAAVAPVIQQQSATDPTVGRAVAASTDEHGCEPVWLEINADWESGRGPYHKEIAYGLAETGTATTATSYAKIGQEYTTTRNGQLTFEALILQNNETMPDQVVTLTGGWFRPDRGTINGSEFEIVDRINASEGAIRLYAPDGHC